MSTSLDHNVKISIKTRKKTSFETIITKLHLDKYRARILVVKDWGLTLIYALIFATIFKTFFYENFKIPSGSMNPLLLDGDRVLVNKYYYGYSKFSFPFNLAPIKDRILAKRKPQRGDIVVFKLPTKEDISTFYIKRVIGLPNDKIQVKQGRLFINGEPLKYKQIGLLEAKSKTNHNMFSSMEYKEKNERNEYSILISDINSFASNTIEYVVPEGYYFCMGDNRDNSKDSRFVDFGFIPFRNIVGKAEKIFFSTANGELNFNRIFKDIEAKSIQE